MKLTDKNKYFTSIKEDLNKLRNYNEAYKNEGILSDFSIEMLNDIIDNIEKNVENLLD